MRIDVKFQCFYRKHRAHVTSGMRAPSVTMACHVRSSVINLTFTSSAYAEKNYLNECKSLRSAIGCSEIVLHSWGNEI